MRSFFIAMHPRVNAALKAASWHLLASGVIGAAIYFFIFSFWLPEPFATLSQGKQLFVLILLVDMVCGPLLTAVVYNPAKPRGELWRDMALIACIQLGALAYGVHTVHQIRPLWMGFEKDHFRVIALADLQGQALTEAPNALHTRNWLGPQPVGVRMVEGDDPSFLKSLELSLNGLPVAFRPAHWEPYPLYKERVLTIARPASELAARHAGQPGVDALGLITQHHSDLSAMLYLPLSTDRPTDWSVLLDRTTAEIVGYVPLSGWRE